MEYQLADLFEALCDANPAAHCIIAGSTRRSRIQLDGRANQLAHHLTQQGVTTGDHVGIYAYRGAFLRSFVSWPVSSLEATEKLEQLRAMAHGVRIHVEQARAAPPAGVDTAADLEVVRQALERGA